MNSTNTNLDSGVTKTWSSTVASWGSTNTYTEPKINTGSKTKPTTGDTNIPGVDTTSWKYGVYYNYCAATVGTYCQASGSGTGNATKDICPAGWRLATNSTSG